MGQVEVEDQVLGIQTAAQIVDFIDLGRIGIMGWSYGGFLSLMAIAKNPDVFKVCYCCGLCVTIVIATQVCASGAPVTDWFYYDTAYTERYLGIPPRDSSVYSKSSVLEYASSFPAEYVLCFMCASHIIFSFFLAVVEKY